MKPLVPWRWKWSLALAVLRGRVITVEHSWMPGDWEQVVVRLENGPRRLKRWPGA